MEAVALTLMLMPITLGARSLPLKCASTCPLVHCSVFSKGDLLVTKKEIVKTISEEIGLTQLKTKEIVQKTFDAIIDTLVEDERIELRNFGVFEVKRRAARKARNPRTGEKVFVPEKFVVTFKPGKEMEERVKELERRAAAESAAANNIVPPHASPSQTPPPSANGENFSPTTTFDSGAGS